jgi:hypothetical protein
MDADDLPALPRHLASTRRIEARPQDKILRARGEIRKPEQRTSIGEVQDDAAHRAKAVVVDDLRA